jgi:predicted Zn-dependent protease
MAVGTGLRDITETVLEASDAEATEVIVTERDAALTRFANNEIHQNVTETNITVRVRVVLGRRTGVASTNQTDPESLRGAVEIAKETARNQPEQDMVTPMPTSGSFQPSPLDEATINCTPQQRAELVVGICGPAQTKQLRAFGALSTGRISHAIANSNGLLLETSRAVADLKVVAMTDGGAGYADRVSSHLSEIDAAATGAEAMEKAQRTRGAEPIEPGEYPVVLEEYAVGELLEYLAYMGFSGLSVEEGRSFMRPGEKITGDNITIWDDGHDPSGLPMQFDFEGVVKKRVDLITRGVATGLVHDLASAARAGMESTGHGLPAPNPFGAWATNLFMAGGDAATREDLASGIDRGVWVTRLWYVNPVHPKNSQLTGMTREGTFLIENGRVTRPIKDMRFTQSIMEAFQGATALTRDTKLQGGSDYDFVSAARVPAVQLKSFNFTSVTR